MKGGAAMATPGPNIADQLSLHAVQRPTKPAIIHRDTDIDYRQLDRMVRQRAALLLEMGVRPGEVVGVALKDTPEHLILLYAVARAGAVVLPVDCRWTGEEKRRVAEHFGARRVMVEPDDLFAPGLCVAADASWLAQAKHAPAREEFPGGDHGFCLSLSSGTTGRPKGPLLSHAQFMSRFFTHYADLGFGSREVYVNATPLYFGGGRAFSVSSLYVGATVVLCAPPYKVEELAAEIERRAATITFLVPTLLRRILQAEPAARAPFRRLRTLIASGSPLTAEERGRIRDEICPDFIEYYSSTEGGGVTVLSAQEQAAYPASVGRPVFGVRLEIVDEHDRPLPRGEVGRIRYDGATVARGFYRDDDASREAFRDGFFYPGDLGYLNEEGYLFLCGRAKDMIIRGGVNIYPLEIESVLMTHPGVLEAAVVGVPSTEFGEEVAAFVLPRGAQDAAALAAWCRERLAPYKVPKHFRFVSDFERNSAGKIVKGNLAASLSAA